MTRICIEVDGDGNGTTEPRVRTYSTVVGDASQVDFNVDHNLNSQAVFAVAYDANTGEVVQDYTLTLVNANRSRIHFDTAPAADGIKLQMIAVEAPQTPAP